MKMKKIVIAVISAGLALSIGIGSTKIVESFQINKTQAAGSTKIMWGKTELKQGQIGKITVLKHTDLLKYSKDKKSLEKVRQLNPGEEYRVYSYKGDFNGLYGVGGSSFVKKSNAIKYETPSKAKLRALKEMTTSSVTNLKPVFKQKELASLIESLDSFKSKSQIVYSDNENLAVYLHGGYKKGMGLASINLPRVAIFQNDTQDSISLTFRKRFEETEKKFLKELLQVYYPNSYEKVYSVVINHKASVGNGNYITKTYDGRSFGIYRGGKDLMPVVDIGRN